MDDGIRLRPGTHEDFPAICDLLGVVFHEEFEGEAKAAERDVFEPERSLVADDSGLVAGHAQAFSRELTVPGAIVPAAHISGVGVQPTHRRRGLLTALMHRQLHDIAAAGREPLAVLWASETTIYPRFGYGAAASRLTFDVMNREVRLTVPPVEPAGRLRMGDPFALLSDLGKLYEQARAGRVGWSERDDRWWRFVLTDAKDDRDGATKRYAVVHDGPSGPTGYALWRVKHAWSHHGPDAEVQVREVVAADPGTYQALWRFLLGIDLSRRVTFTMGAVDEPLPHLIDEPRRLGLSLTDSLFVRLVDVPAALAARRYRAPVDVVLEVEDPILPANAGRWRLTGGPDGAACVRTGDPADLTATVTDLGAAYLGGTSLSTLTAAGRVRLLTGNDPSLAFGWHRAPSATEVF
ncbi:GNAT family N-acetyltransferase [Actinoplanes sp. NPDC020271]|uniref:GNAT family N-acetyltransferase n=1 Tax=Actinoplanes sp. NPDC020271 TaxID=3363896 RepID=UPI00378BB69A